MTGTDLVSPAELWDSLAAAGLALPESRGVSRVEDLSPGLGYSRVFRVHQERPPGRESRPLILKIPGWGEGGGESLVAPRDPLLSRREAMLARSGLAARLPAGLAMPEILAVDQRSGRTWLWMRDLSPWLTVRWSPGAARRVAAGCALLHELYLREPAWRDLPWLGREEHAAYSHHIPLAHRNLAALPTYEAWSDLLPAGALPRLHEALDLFPEWMEQMRGLPETYVHGDFHIRNLGLYPDGTLLAIDWACFGIAPLGCDLAAFLSVYRVFGGAARDEAALERSLLDVYTAEVERIAGESGLRAPIEHAGHLWHLLWGLHLRLGPGLTALFEGYIQDEKDRERTAVDVRSGCLRALSGMDALRGAA